jgi:hypothetical protein
MRVALPLIAIFLPVPEVSAAENTFASKYRATYEGNNQQCLCGYFRFSEIEINVYPLDSTMMTGGAAAHLGQWELSRAWLFI